LGFVEERVDPLIDRGFESERDPSLGVALCGSIDCLVQTSAAYLRRSDLQYRAAFLHLIRLRSGDL
jgi:hypothetical protein